MVVSRKTMLVTGECGSMHRQFSHGSLQCYMIRSGNNELLVGIKIIVYWNVRVTPIRSRMLIHPQ